MEIRRDGRKEGNEERDRGDQTKNRGLARREEALVSHPIKSPVHPSGLGNPRGIKCSIGLQRVPIVK